MTEIDTVVVVHEPDASLTVTSVDPLEVIVAVEAQPSLVVVVEETPTTVVVMDTSYDAITVAISDYAPGPKGDTGLGVPEGGDPGNIILRTATGTEWVAPEAIFDFVIADWLGPASGNYTLPVQHNLEDASVTVEVSSGGNVFVTDRRIDDANLVTLIVPASPDLRFEGTVRISRL